MEAIIKISHLGVILCAYVNESVGSDLLRLLATVKAKNKSQIWVMFLDALCVDGCSGCSAADLQSKCSFISRTSMFCFIFAGFLTLVLCILHNCPKREKCL